ncbi:EF-hand domain-containing protein [Thermaurantiacus sp.]
MSRSRLILLLRLLPVVLAIPLLFGVAFLWNQADDGGAQAAASEVAHDSAQTLPVAEAAEGIALPELPAPTPKSREEKRFARADRDDDGVVSAGEFVAARRRNFDKLDANGDGRLSFEEYAAEGLRKFAGADADGDGRLNPAEFATTARPPASRTARTTNKGSDCACG